MLTRLYKRLAPRRRSADRVNTYTTQIGAGFLFVGAAQGSGHWLVQGEVVSDMDIQGSVVLSAGAYWQGDLTADFIQIAGKVQGNVIARSKIDMAPTAVVSGDLASPVIAIAEGAIYEGTISRRRKTQVTRYNERRDSKARKPSTAD